MQQDNIAGNFDLGTCFAEVRCRHRHKTRLFNIGRDHFVACDVCHTYIHIGGNLMSSWRQEDRSVWARNARSIQGYREVD